MKYIFLFLIFYLIFCVPIMLLTSCIQNIIKYFKTKKSDKKIIKKAIIHGVIFILIILFYIWFIYALTDSIRHNLPM